MGVSGYGVGAVAMRKCQGRAMNGTYGTDETYASPLRSGVLLEGRSSAIGDDALVDLLG
jgi:hypothetical protein